MEAASIEANRFCCPGAWSLVILYSVWIMCAGAVYEPSPGHRRPPLADLMEDTRATVHTAAIRRG